MFQSFINIHPFYETPGSGSGGGSKELTVDEIYDALGDDDKAEEEAIDLEDDKDKPTKKEAEPDEDDKEEVPEEKEEDDELEELVEDLEEPDEEKLELVTPVRRKEILKVYPDLFKKFPYLEKAMYREQQYSEIVPTIDDAKEAVAKADVLDKVENDLSNGNIETMLHSVKASNPKAFGKLIDNYLIVLSKVDKDAFLHVNGTVIKHTIMQMASEARNTGDADLQAAAAALNKFVFGSTEFIPPTKLVDDREDKVDPEKEQFEKERREFNQTKFSTVNNELSTKVNNALLSTINKNIDPKNSMTDYVRRNASRDAMETLTSLLTKDARFRVIVDKLWENAIKNKYSPDSVDKIRSAFYSKAKTLLPSVIKKARNEALKGTGKRTSADSQEKESKVKGEDKEERSSSKSSDKTSKIPKGMTSLEFLMQD